MGSSIKYEEIYLRAYDTVSEAGSSIGPYLDFYNGRRPHSRPGRQTPDQAYFSQPLLAAAQPRQTIHLSKRRACSDQPSQLLGSCRRSLPLVFSTLPFCQLA